MHGSSTVLLGVLFLGGLTGTTDTARLNFPTGAGASSAAAVGRLRTAGGEGGEKEVIVRSVRQQGAGGGDLEGSAMLARGSSRYRTFYLPLSHILQGRVSVQILRGGATVRDRGEDDAERSRAHARSEDTGQRRGRVRGGEEGVEGKRRRRGTDVKHEEVENVQREGGKLGERRERMVGATEARKVGEREGGTDGEKEGVKAGSSEGEEEGHRGRGGEGEREGGEKSTYSLPPAGFPLACNLCGRASVTHGVPRADSGEWEALYCLPCVRQQRDDGVLCIKRGPKLDVTIMHAPSEEQVTYVEFVSLKGRCLACCCQADWTAGSARWCSLHWHASALSTGASNTSLLDLPVPQMGPWGIADHDGTGEVSLFHRQPSSDPFPPCDPFSPRPSDPFPSRRCRYIEGCTRQPAFGNPEEKRRRALFCSEHKPDGFIDVKNPRCGREGCNRRPSYGHTKQDPTLFCAKHRASNHVDVKNTNKCKWHGGVCLRRARYGALNATTPSHCSLHRGVNTTLRS